MDTVSEHSQSIMATSERPDPPARRPSLLPAFEPLSSSPIGLPRPVKRKLDDCNDDRVYYPTPVPTSSTGILPSSPHPRGTRPGLQRTVSALSERAPLGAVPSIEIPFNGEPVHMGRSSNSSDYQLSANRLISRVHVRASYHSPDETRSQGEILVECLGWNGAKVHYQGSVVELAKGESFISQKPGTQIMVDVQETRVLLVWPVVKMEPKADNLWTWPEECSSRDSSLPAERLASSPPPLLPRLHSPVSPSPISQIDVNNTFDSTFLVENDVEDGIDATVQIYEDSESADEALAEHRTPVSVHKISPLPVKVTTPSRTPKELTSSKLLSEPDELSENDEENDPVVHCFGPFGVNLLSKFESFKSASPQRERKPLKSALGSPIKPTNEISTFTRINLSPVKNHVINQLAFSRVHSIPLSTVYNNLPADMRDWTNLQKAGLTSEELKDLMDKIPCIGEIRREGRDAAGKALENEFYYVPEMDRDEHRRDAVSVAKPPLRATRKQHKQYYWKKPRN
ncbi:hypothetical protein BT93_L4771 [Corymbia citriodora subsp. variegata]|uniref:FHA domain-containing protein n=1 Tax=Corymbia citriodora subsp. variegata TaxID=360336 RepID=A0A8T0CKE9_CORYI|nr:hypothetical protein BT93_L4771 [Corymbia citriodora subsp. variegata]